MSKTQPIKNKDKLESFRNYYRESNPRNYALIILGLNTALRIGDVLSLQWKDLYANGDFKSHIVIREQKTGKMNQIAINSAVREALICYMGSSVEVCPNEYIFKTGKNSASHLSRQQAFRIVKAAAQAVGLGENISCHSLRKTFGYYAWQAGTPPVLLMNIYNHSSYEITKRYLCIDQTEKDELYYSNVI